MNRWGEAFLDLVIIGSLVIGFAGGLALTVAELPGNALQSLLVVAALLLLFRLLVVRLRAVPDRQLNWFAGSLIVAGLIGRLVYVLASEQPAISDFGRMWNFAQQAVSGNSLPLDLEQLRAYPFLVPAALLGGKTPLSYQIANCLALAITSLLAYCLIRQSFGPRIGVVALAVTVLVPELTLAAEIPSHDIPTALFLLIGLVLSDRIIRHPGIENNWWRALPLSLLLGGCYVLLDLQRGLSIIVVAACLLSLMDSVRPWRRTARRVLLVVAIPLLTSAGLSRMLERRIAPGAREMLAEHKWRWMAAYANSETSGRFSDARLLWPFYLKLSVDEERDFAIARGLTDLADQPARRIPNYLSRIAGLHLLGDQLPIYLAGAEQPGWRGRFHDAIAAVARPATAGMRLLMLGAGLVGLLGLTATRDRFPRYQPAILFCALLAASLSLLGEHQSRYLVMDWFLLSPAVALILALPREQWGLSAWTRGRLARSAVLAAAVTLMWFGTSLLLRIGYGVDQGRIIRPRLAVDGASRPYSYRLLPGQQPHTWHLTLGSSGQSESRFMLFVRTDDVPTGCLGILRISEPEGRVLTQRLLLPGRAQVMRAELTGPEVVVTAAPADSGRACPVEISYPRLTRAGPKPDP